MNTQTFHRKLDSVMRDNMYEREVAGYRSGKLASRALYKTASGNGRVFSRKQEREHRAYEVTFVVDVSGSMSHTMYDRFGRRDKPRYQIAAECMATVAKGFARNNIRFNIVLFSGVVVEILPMGEHRKYKPEECVEQVKSWQQGYRRHPADGTLSPTGVARHYSGIGNCTHTRQAVELVLERWKHEPTEIPGAERIVMFFTDGDPGCSGCYDTLPGGEFDYRGLAGCYCEGSENNIWQDHAQIAKDWRELGTLGHAQAFIIAHEAYDTDRELYTDQLRVIQSQQAFMDQCVEALKTMLRRG